MTKDTAGMTIDELARRAGITTRNVRAYQERGLLPPPRRVGRTGYYDDGHVARLRVIGELLERGYSLAAIADLLAVWARGGDVADLLGLERALARPWSEEEPLTVTAEELAERFPDSPGALERALELGLVEPDGDFFRVPSMRLLDVGSALRRAGVPIEAVLDEAGALQADTERIAERFVSLVHEHVFAPFLEAGGPSSPGDVKAVTDLVEQLRPLVADAVLAALAQAMERAVAGRTGNVIAAVDQLDAEAAG